MDTLQKAMLDILKQYDKEKKAAGFIPTVEMFINDIEEKFNGK